MAWARSRVQAQPSRVDNGVGAGLNRLCLAVTRSLDMSGAVITLRSTDGSEAIAAASDGTSRALAKLEFGAGEGPSRAAFEGGRPVLVSDLDDPADAPWIGYAPAATKSGVRGVFAFPLHRSGARFGVLTMLTRTRRHLDEQETSRCLALAELATELLLASSDATTDGEIDPDLKSSLDFRSEIYQAQGMVMASLATDLPTALARLRSHAFLEGRPLLDVAVDVIERRLTLTQEGQDP